MYLLDTNIWLERMLDQEKSDEVKQILDVIPTSQMFITDFSLHSIGVILYRLHKSEAFVGFVQDLLIDGSVGVVSVPPKKMERLVSDIHRFRLDFDDAYQYIAAFHHDLTMISFDKDFDRTDRGRLTPKTLLTMLL